MSTKNPIFQIEQQARKHEYKREATSKEVSEMRRKFKEEKELKQVSESFEDRIARQYAESLGVSVEDLKKS